MKVGSAACGGDVINDGQMTVYDDAVVAGRVEDLDWWRQDRHVTDSDPVDLIFRAPQDSYRILLSSPSSYPLCSLRFLGLTWWDSDVTGWRSARLPIVAKRCVLPKNCLKKQIGNGIWRIEWSRDRWRHKPAHRPFPIGGPLEPIEPLCPAIFEILSSKRIFCHDSRPWPFRVLLLQTFFWKDAPFSHNTYATDRQIDRQTV